MLTIKSVKDQRDPGVRTPLFDDQCFGMGTYGRIPPNLELEPPFKMAGSFSATIL